MGGGKVGGWLDGQIKKKSLFASNNEKKEGGVHLCTRRYSIEG